MWWTSLQGTYLLPSWLHMRKKEQVVLTMQTQQTLNFERRDRDGLAGLSSSRLLPLYFFTTRSARITRRINGLQNQLGVPLRGFPFCTASLRSNNLSWLNLPRILS